MSSQKDKEERKKTLYSEDFQAMLERIEEEDNAEKSGQITRKNRLCLEKVKALEKHFEEENKLQPERKVKIAEEVGLEPRQVAIWFQNRRARWRTKQLEREYDDLRANYDALKLDYGSLEQEHFALLAQLKDLKEKIEARNLEMTTTPTTPTLSIPTTTSINCVNNVGFSESMAPSSCSTATSDPFAMASMDGIQLCKAYQDHLMKMEELGVHNTIHNDLSGNFFSIDQPPTLHYW